MLNSIWNFLLCDVFNIVCISFVIIAGSRKTHSNDVWQNVWAVVTVKEDNGLNLQFMVVYICLVLKWMNCQVWHCLRCCCYKYITPTFPFNEFVALVRHRPSIKWIHVTYFSKQRHVVNLQTWGRLSLEDSSSGLAHSARQRYREAKQIELY